MGGKEVGLTIVEDQDALWVGLEIPVVAGSPVVYRSCFYRSVPTGDGEHVLIFEEKQKMFDPKKVYGDAPNPTIL